MFTGFLVLEAYLILNIWRRGAPLPIARWCTPGARAWTSGQKGLGLTDPVIYQPGDLEQVIELPRASVSPFITFRKIILNTSQNVHGGGMA